MWQCIYCHVCIKRKNDKRKGTKLPYNPKLGEHADVTADAEDSPI